MTAKTNITISIYDLMNAYMAIPYSLEVFEDPDEGGFVASYPDLPGCITCGDTLDDVYTNAIDAKKEWLLATLEMEQEIPLPSRFLNNREMSYA